MHNKDIQTRRILPSNTLLDALTKMDSEHVRLLFIMDGSKLIDLVSIGDIQRALLAKIGLSTSLIDIQIGKKIIADETTPEERIKELMIELRLECMPVIKKTSRELIKIILWDDLFPEKPTARSINLPVVIMAGGEGTRLKPLTNIIPKPLVPVNDKAIVHEIMDRFSKYECSNFIMSVNYKADLIEYYFNSLDHNFDIKYISEEKPTGTAGSLSLMKDYLKTTFFVINCDILIDEDYFSILDYHRANNNELTMVSVIKHYPIPYGVINTTADGVLSSIEEKPDYIFQINSGMYVLEPHLLDEIPEDTFFHITHLIDKIKNRGGRVGVFPVSSGSWYDIGEWGELVSTYKKYRKYT